MPRWRTRGACECRPLKLAIVGAFSGTHIAGSLARAAESLGVETVRIDTADASRGPRLMASLRWRLADRQPLRLHRFSASVVDLCRSTRPDVLLATGSAALTAPALQALRAQGVLTVNFSTDDPWSATVGSAWHRRALSRFDVVFSPRRANLADLQALCCPDVRYLPFGYDETLFSPPDALADTTGPDVLFVGGGDRDRARFVKEFVRSGPPITLVGGYWQRFGEPRANALGLKDPETLRVLTASAKVNLCLVRKANRDGHVMRSFEIAAVGGCMLVEDTAEHRAIFGDDGASVVYFRSPAEAAARASALIADPDERARLAKSVYDRIQAGHHTYRDRLRTMLGAFADLSAASESVTTKRAVG
jgi:spore maturation protein CgeB